MRADRTVIVIGAFLFAIGLAVAWNGYGYVQLERGWTQVISGTFAACAGLILVALGLVLRELARIASSADRATLLLAKGRAGFPAESPFAPPPAPTYAPPLEEVELAVARTVAEAPPPSEFADPRQGGPLSWMVRGARTAPAPEPEMPQAEESDAWPRKPLADPREERVEVPWGPEPEPARETFAAPPETGPLARQATELSPEELDEHVREGLPEPEPEFAHPPQPEPEPEPEPLPVHEPAHEIHQELAHEAVHEFPHEVVHEAVAEALHEPVAEPVHEPVAEPVHEPVAEPVDEPVVEPVHESVAEPVDEPVAEPVHAAAPATAEPAHDFAPKPAIIGEYDAQGAHYTLYADGSIEAETPHGVYRFASMAELKRFIEGEG